MLHRLKLVLESIKFAHSVFALPFALIAMLAAARGWPSARTGALIVVCMVSARSAAMAFNRLADRKFDALNPRTCKRPTVTGAVSPAFLVLFTGLASAVFVLAAWLLNTACVICALPVLAILLGYSYAKRFTWLCHFWLGLALGLAPLGAHLAVCGNLEPLDRLGGRWSAPVEFFPVLLGLMVLFWVAGFDIIYACQDYAVDCADPRLYSLPKRLGLPAALRAAQAAHACAAALLVLAGLYAGLGVWYFGAAAIAAGLLAYEHWIVRPGDLSRVNTAFFTLNGAVGVLLLAAVVIEQC